VNYGERGPGVRQFRVKASEPAEAFEAWADKVELFDPYRGDDPGLVYHRIVEITERKREKEAAERYAREEEAGRRLFQMQKEYLARLEAGAGTGRVELEHGGQSSQVHDSKK
jgi:hypothetical protein